jgi:hypothetical protein
MALDRESVGAGRYPVAMPHPTKDAESEVERRRAAAERMRGMFGHDPSRSFSDELIANRRVEAVAEDLEDEARRHRGGNLT